MAVYEDEAGEHKEETNPDETLASYCFRPRQEARHGQVIKDNGKGREKAHRSQSRELRSASLNHKKADEIYQLCLKYACRKLFLSRLNLSPAICANLSRFCLLAGCSVAASFVYGAKSGNVYLG